MVSQRSLRDSKSPLVSRVLLSIQTDLNNAVVWMVSTRPLISKSFRPCSSPLGTIPRAPISIGITVTFMFHSFFLFSLQGPRTYLSPHFLSILLSGQPGQQSPQIGNFFSSSSLSLGLVVWPRLGDPFVSQNPWAVCASHSLGQIMGCEFTIYLCGQISILSAIPSGSSSSPSRV